MNSSPINIAVLEEDASQLQLLHKVLDTLNVTVQYISTPKAFCENIKKQEPNIILCSYELSTSASIDIFHFCKEHYPHASFILLAATLDVNEAIALIKEGVYDIVLRKDLSTLTNVLHTYEHSSTMLIDIPERNKADQDIKLLLNNTTEAFVLINADLYIVSFNDRFEQLYLHNFGIEIKKGDNIVEYAQPDRRDITERKNAEESIRISNERYNLLVKATNDAIWDWDINTGNVFRIGNGLETLFGYDAAQASLSNTFWIEKVHPDDVDSFHRKRNKIIADSSQNFWEDEYRFLKAGGNYAFVYDKGLIIRNADGIAMRMIGSTQDITQRKETELLLQKLNEKLEKRAQELQESNLELERFAYVASHDLQEPLRMVSSFLQLLEKKYKGHLDSTADQYIQFAVDGAFRMKKLIQDLLEYSRAGSIREIEGNTDMNEVVKEVLAVFSERIEEQEAIITTSSMPVLNHARKTQLFQLMQNLVSNALKFHSNEKPLIVISAQENETHWIFTVQDNGIGFDKKYREKVFVIFQRLHSKDAFSGTGIGLSICKKIVERHNGSIWVESEPGKGTTFFFSIKK